MSGNETQKNQNENMTPREIVLRALEEVKLEMFRAQSIADFISEGFAFLQKASEGRFAFGPAKSDTPDETLLMTNVQIKGKVMRLHVTVDSQGKVLTNLPDADASPALDGFQPTEEQKNDAASRADHCAAMAGGMTEEEKQKIYDNSIEVYKRQAQNAHDHAEVTTTATTKAGALADIAAAAVMGGYVLSVPETEAPSAAQEAVMDGLRKGLRCQQMQIMMTEGAAKPFTDGLKFLETLSDGQLDVTATLEADGSALEIRVKAVTLDPHSEPFRDQFLKVYADGRVHFLDNYGNHPANQTYEAHNEADITLLLTAIAKLAVFAGKVSFAPGQEIETTSAEQEAVLAALRQAEGERAMAHLAASNLDDGLSTLKAQLDGQFTFEKVEASSSAAVVFVLNSWKPSRSQIDVDGNGVITMGESRYNAFDRDSLNEALKGITRNAARANNPAMNKPFNPPAMGR